MGAYYDLAAGAATLKELYPDGQLVDNEVYEENPLYTMIEKKTDFYGEWHPVPLQYGVSNHSASFTNAQGNQAPAKLIKFLVTRATDYALGTLDNQTMLATANDEGAFIAGATVVVDAAIQSLMLSLTSSLFRSGTGSIGQVSTSTPISTGVITLQDPNSVVQFEKDMVLQINQTDGGATPVAALGYVVSVDRIAGTVTVASSGFGGTPATPIGWSGAPIEGYYILNQGDLNAKITGLSGWLPGSTAPASTDNFFNVNRSVDRWRLAGGYYNGAALPLDEALTNGLLLVNREGSGPDIGVCNFASYAALEVALGQRVQYMRQNFDANTADISFEGIKVKSPKGAITIIPDRNCQSYTAYMLKKKTWTLRTLGEAPMILRYMDTNEMLRVYNADAAELRVGMYGNLECNAPGRNIVISLGA